MNSCCMLYNLTFKQTNMKLTCLSFFVCLVSAKLYQEECSNEALTRDNLERKYQPIWDDLDTRPLPEWYDQAKVGIFIHWGLYAVPSFGSEWFWAYWHSKATPYVKFMDNYYPPGFTYQEFAPMFTAELFDPSEWADILTKSGAKYVVLTSKHHEGFTLFPSKRSFSWNSVDVGPRRDIVGELSKAVRDKAMKFGVYHSLYEWFNPIYLEDKGDHFTTRNYPESKLLPDIKQLVNDYKPSVIWSDGDWEASDTYWNSTDLLAWLYNDSPVKDEVVVNDRWGIGIPCNHGDFYNCKDRFNPGELQKHKWENAFTMDKVSWGYRRNLLLNDVMTTEELLKEVVTTVSCGGNALINIGPTKEGTIIPIFQERLLTLGKWLEINGEAIYASSPWKRQNDTKNPDVWYTCTKSGYNGLQPTAVPRSADRVTAIYALVLMWPENGVLKVRDITPTLHTGNYKARLLGNEENYLHVGTVDSRSTFTFCTLDCSYCKGIEWIIKDGIANIMFPNKASVKSEYAWTVKFTS